MLTSLLICALGAFAQTDGTATFRVTTQDPADLSEYNPKNVMAIWVTDSSGTFVKTLKRQASERIEYLVKWVANSNEDVTDAVTGATISSHETHNVSWDCTDTSGSLVADGTYRVRVEFTTQNGQGPYTPTNYIQFTKGTSPVTLNPANYNYTTSPYTGSPEFIDMQLIYTPTVVPHNVRAVSISAPATANPGDLVAIQSLISNRTVTAESAVSVVLSNLTDGVQIQANAITSLPGNGSSTEEFTWDTTGLTTGTYTIAVTAGPVAGEADTTDNTQQTSVLLRDPAHDVSATLVAPAQTNVGSAVGLNVLVTNLGEMAETFDVQLLDKRTNAILRTWNVVGLAVGAHSNLVYTWDTTDHPSATYRLQAVAASVGSETNAYNNFSTAFIDLVNNPTAPDIAVTRLAVPGTAFQGDQVPIGVSVANEGNSNETFSIALSDGGVPLATEPVTNLQPEASHTWTYLWDTRAASLTGHTIVASVASGPGEVDTSDNVRSNVCAIASDGIGALSHAAAGNIGGAAACIALSGSTAYVGEGSSLAVIDISTPAAPFAVGRLHLVDSVEDIAVDGDYAYAACGRAGVHVVDVTAPTSPVYLTTIDTPGHAYEVALSSNHLLVAAGSGGLRIINVTTPSSPTVAAVYMTEGPAHAVYVSGSTAFVADHDQGIVAIDVSNPTTPLRRGGTASPSFAQCLRVSGSTLYVGDGDGYVSLFDVSSPANITTSGTVRLSAPVGGMALSGSHIFAAAGGAGLQMVDVSAPSVPTNVSGHATAGWASDVAIRGSHAFVADGLGGLVAVDVSAPLTPSGAGTLNAVTRARGTVLAGSLVYVAAGSDGVRVYSITNLALPVLVGTMPSGTNACDVALVSNLLHVAAGQHGLVLADISTPETPLFQGRYTGTGLGAVRCVAATVNRTVVTDGEVVHLIDTSTPSAPVWLDTYDAPGYVYAMVRHGSHLYLAAGHAGVVTVDMSVSSAFGSTHQLAIDGLCVDIDVAGGVAYVAGSTGWHTLDLAVPGAPTLANSDTSGGAVKHVAVVDDLLHLAEGNPEVRTLYLGTPLTPIASGSFGAVMDAMDIATDGIRAIVAEDADGVGLYDSAGDDRDNDGLTDGIEQQIIDAKPGDGLNRHADVSPTDDFDHDGLNNYGEQVAGTSATDPSSVLAITSAAEQPGGDFILRWYSVAGRTYAVHSSTNLVAGFYLLEGSIGADPPVNSYTTTVSTASAFFMIEVEP